VPSVTARGRRVFFSRAGLARAFGSWRPRFGDRFIRLAPIAQFRLREGPVALECGTKLDRRHFCPRVSWIRTAVTLRDRHTGEQKRRHCHKNSSHGSLDIDMRARTRARNTARAKARAPRSVRRQRTRGGLSRPASWTPGGGCCEKTYLAVEGEDRIERRVGPAIEAEAQQAVHGPQCEFSPLSWALLSPECEWEAWS